MPTEREWAKMSKKEREAYADTSGGPGGSFSGKSYPQYEHGWLPTKRTTDSGKGFKNLAHKNETRG